MVHDQKINMTERLDGARHQSLGVRRIAKVQGDMPHAVIRSAQRVDHAGDSYRIGTPGLSRIVW